METIHYLLMKIHAKLNRWVLEEAHHIGLTAGQPKVLECLLAYGEMNQKSIADCCEIEAATVGSILSRMERDGLIVRTQREGNRRALYVSLSPQGKRKAQEMQCIFQRADEWAMSPLSMDEQEQLLTLLRKLAQVEYKHGEEFHNDKRKGN